MYDVRELQLPIYSTLNADPSLNEVIASFVAELPRRINYISRLASVGNWRDLARSAHQLKGAAGSYGFGPVISVARQLEKLALEGSDHARIVQAAEDVVEICRSCRAGAPD